jgi:hypothetical protein
MLSFSDVLLKLSISALAVGAVASFCLIVLKAIEQKI